MKTYKILTCIFLMTSLFTQACQKDDDSQDTPVPPSPEEEVPASQFDYVYSQGVDGYEVYRIPAIVKTQSNTLLAFAEARKARSNGDSAFANLLCVYVGQFLYCRFGRCRVSFCTGIKQ